VLWTLVTAARVLATPGNSTTLFSYSPHFFFWEIFFSYDVLNFLIFSSLGVYFITRPSDRYLNWKVLAYLDVFTSYSYTNQADNRKQQNNLTGKILHFTFIKRNVFEMCVTVSPHSWNFKPRNLLQWHFLYVLYITEILKALIFRDLKNYELKFINRQGL
jgi:hypothetical protein